MTDMTPREARDYLVKELRRFMVGPHDGENEIFHAGEIRCQGERQYRNIVQTGYDFYHTGFLSPADTAIDEEEDDQEEQGSDIDQGAGEGIMVMANAAQQSAMGLTFQVENPEVEIVLTADWGQYQLEEESVEVEPVEQEQSHMAAGSQTPPAKSDNEPGKDELNSGQGQWKTCGKLCWRRIPMQRVFRFQPMEIGNGKSLSPEIEDGVQLQVRRREVNGKHFVTASIVNRNQFPDTKRKENDVRIYQVRLTVEAADGASVFVGSQNTARRRDEDFWEQELLYRDVQQFAVGHGCAVTWEEAGQGCAQQIATEWIPECEVYKASPAVGEDDMYLELERLADKEFRSAALEGFRKLADSYSNWIDDKRGKIPNVVAGFPEYSAEYIRDAAERNLDACGAQQQRIVDGISYLESHEKAFEAFRLANAAIARSMQIARPGNTPKWFPFQLAFILIALPSLSNRGHPDRRTLDLIWFPTGGGKTEAYLGLSAYALFHRGLIAKNADEAGGTTIITRYTLRTLTVQQFERTTLAIMACENVRASHPVLSAHHPWSIGLLVGTAATPKWLLRKRAGDGSAEDLLEKRDKDAQGALLPLKKCPWCGTALGLDQLHLDHDNKALLTHCKNEACEFHNGIPIRIIDEHLVNDPPSFVVATIDKFAQLAWEPELARLLGRSTDAAPPDLIIQDELHLISDSLGTIAGLYEIAIDALASRDGIGPKIVGATATIKRAGEQVKSLFLRGTAQFPPSGIEAADSFFYSEDTDQPGRLYVGIHAQGRSPKHTLPRILGTFAQGATQIEPRAVRDAYWTIVCYFNSLRELGAALVVAEDDVPAYQKTLARVTGQDYRPLGLKVEMTSQVPSVRIPEILDELQVGLESEQADRDPIGLLLATSMISVGVDVDRLGLMVIGGQPKTTAEYIQASSRVGRPKGSAGLVVTQYNWTRPRDRSHYERFMVYHRSFYRFVEAVSVTPFSPRARDKALAGVVATMLRTMIGELQENKISRPEDIAENLDHLIAPVRDIILSRVEAVDAREVDDTREHLQQLFDEVKDFLLHNAGSEKFWIRWRLDKHSKDNGDFMLGSGMNPAEDDSPWVAMLSMRDTDSPAPLRLELNRRQ